MINLLPKAIEQANSRIISNKMIKNEDKILSAYHDNVNVIKRGKAGGQFEYGNPLFIAEQKDGVILDWKLYETDVKEPQSTKESIKRLTEDLNYEIKSLTGYRGCQSEANDKLLQKKAITSGLCPRDPAQFIEKWRSHLLESVRKGELKQKLALVYLKILFSTDHFMNEILKINK